MSGDVFAVQRALGRFLGRDVSASGSLAGDWPLYTLVAAQLLGFKIVHGQCLCQFSSIVRLRSRDARAGRLIENAERFLGMLCSRWPEQRAATPDRSGVTDLALPH